MNNRDVQTALVATANADYVVNKNNAKSMGHSHDVTIRSLEKEWGLNKNQLTYFRANLTRRKSPVPEIEI